MVLNEQHYSLKYANLYFKEMQKSDTHWFQGIYTLKTCKVPIQLFLMAYNVLVRKKALPDVATMPIEDKIEWAENVKRYWPDEESKGMIRLYACTLMVLNYCAEEFS